MASAKTITEVGEIYSWYDGLAKTSRGIGRDAEIEAAEIAIRTKRKLGELMVAASKTGSDPVHAAAGVSKNLADSARRLGAMEPDKFQHVLASWRQLINGDGERVTANLPEPPKEARTFKGRTNISLKAWEGMSADEKRECLDPANYPSDAPMNAQSGPGIEWAQKSWNPIVGCKHDCPYCYARDIAMRYTDAFPYGFEPAFRPATLHAPRNTALPKAAMFDARYSNVFAGSMTDWFGRWVPREWIEAVLDVIRQNQVWKFLCLTKFPKRMAEFDLPPNMWPGTTVDLQARVANAEAAFAKIRERNPKATLWLSIEPMLEPVKFKRLDLFNWIVIGGASASSQTPTWHPPFRWIMDICAQARDAGCQVYMKTNLLGNRILELPFNAKIQSDPTEAPPVFHYLGKARDGE